MTSDWLYRLNARLGFGRVGVRVGRSSKESEDVERRPKLEDQPSGGIAQRRFPSSAGRACPQCQLPAVRIIYGYPTPELSQEAKRGSISLGGCVVRRERWMCQNCGQPFF